MFASVVRRVGLAPLASITQMSTLPPARSLEKAILVPSGDQAGWPLMTPGELFVRFVWPEPSAFITKISLPPTTSRTNAILVLSGDQVGAVSSAGSLVRFVEVEPSGLATTISESPAAPMMEAKAI